jgi:hypothetical protein
MNTDNVTPETQEEKHTYLILSGEGNMDTEHQFCLERETLEDANAYFDRLKQGDFCNTQLFIYKAIKLREQ